MDDETLRSVDLAKRLRRVVLHVARAVPDGDPAGRGAFGSILDEEAPRVEAKAEREAAAFLLVGQALAYRILGRDRPLPAVPRGLDGAGLAAFFGGSEAARRQPAAFAPRLPAVPARAVDATLRALDEARPERLPVDVLGKVFHNLIPRAVRKVVAAYYTNSEAADLLATLTVTHADARVLDPACGSGALLIAAWRAKRALGGGAPSDLEGRDVMPASAHLAAVQLALHAGDGPRIALADGTTRGRHPPVDVVLMNPPFTRFQRLPPALKATLRSRFADYPEITGQLALHGYFLLLADRVLAPGGRLGAVLPASTLSGKAFQGVVERLLTDYTVEHVVTTTGRAAFSDDADFREVMLVAEKRPPRAGHRVRLATLADDPSRWTSAVARDRAGRMADAAGAGQPLQAALARDGRALAERLALSTDLGLAAVSALDVAFAGLPALAEVLRGLDATVEESLRAPGREGAFDLIVLSDPLRALKRVDRWVLEDGFAFDRATGKRAPFDPASAAPCLRRISQSSHLALEGREDWVALAPLDGVAPPRGWDRWRATVTRHTGRLALLYKMDLGAPGTRALAVHHPKGLFCAGDAWRVEADDDEALRILALWLNTASFALALVRVRSETRGSWIRLDKGLMARIPAPDPGALDAATRRRLLDLYERAREAPLGSLWEDVRDRRAPRVDLDRAFLETVRAPDGTLEAIYAGLEAELGNLRAVLRYDGTPRRPSPR
ncbi:MAG TPA: N-6 DNA methylase [Candidatus Thermoplasmatota archaeon]|nr:N-6 DNA methylase [Candidatus Thermoplasmatota archaeon]